MEGGVKVMEWLTSATEAVVGVVGSVINLITTVPVLSLCFVGTCIMPLGARLFKKLRS